METNIHPSLSQDYMNLSNLTTIQDALIEAMTHSLFYIIIADAGYGKTSAFIDFKMQYSNCFLVTLDPQLSSRKQFLMDLLKEISKRQYDESLLDSKTLARLINLELSKINNYKLIIIDDAGRFQSNHMQLYQYIRDNTFGDTGIILSGTTEFLNNLLKWKQRNKDGIPELISRVNKFVVQDDIEVHSINMNLVDKSLKQPTKEEYMALCYQNGIDNPTIASRLIYDCENLRELASCILNYKTTLAKKQKKSSTQIKKIRKS